MHEPQSFARIFDVNFSEYSFDRDEIIPHLQSLPIRASAGTVGVHASSCAANTNNKPEVTPFAAAPTHIGNNRNHEGHEGYEHEPDAGIAEAET